MNTQKRLFLLALVVVAAFGAVVAVATARAARAGAREEPRVNTLPPVGITDGQTLRVNFFNGGAQPFEIIPCVFDDDGAHLKLGAPLRLAPGQTRSFDLSRAEISRRDGLSVLVRGAAYVRNADARNLVVTGEVIEDATGKSSLFVPGLRVGFDPQPDPPAPN